MGGNAIKQSERISKDELPYCQAVVRTFLIHNVCILEGVGFKFVKSYYDKQDYGDIDVVVNNRLCSPEGVINKVKEKLGEDVEVYRNNKFLSVGFPIDWSHKPYLEVGTKRVVQVDFIFENNMSMACNYYNWNDLGNLIGRQAKKLGFKYGHEGLVYLFRDGDHIYKEEIVSQDILEILPFLGFYSEKFILGFKTLEDIFKFVASGEYFNPDIYLLDNLNSVSRIRDKKRKTYTEFLKWCKEIDFTGYSIFPKDAYTEELKQSKLGESFKVFKGWKDRYDNTQKEYAEHLAKKVWWNGDKAKSLTGLEGRELGNFMKGMKTVYNMDECFNLGVGSEIMAQVFWDYFWEGYAEVDETR